MRVILNRAYQEAFSTYRPEEWRARLCQDARADIRNWPPEEGKYRLDICVLYGLGNAGLRNTDIDNVAKIVVDGIFCTDQPGTGADRFLYEMSVVKARYENDGLEVTLYDLGPA